MLPTINLIKTDITEIAPAAPESSGKYGLDGDFRASLGEVLELQLADVASGSSGLPGEVLPPDGNELPVATAMPETPQVMVQNPRTAELPPPDTALDVTAIALDDKGVQVFREQPGRRDVRSVDDWGDRLRSAPVDWQLPSDSENTSVPDLQPVAIDVSPAGMPPAMTPVVPVDLMPTPRLRELTSSTPHSPKESIADIRATLVAVDRTAIPQADPAIAAERPASTRLLDVAQHNVTTSAPVIVADKAELLQKHITPPVSAASAVDNPLLSQGAELAPRPASVPVVPTTISVPTTDDGWGEALGQKLVWMTGNSIQKAEIRLNPAELGPIRIEVSMSDDAAATVTFSAQHAVTREAIDAAMPRLRDMLGENGITLANTDVSDADVRHEQQAGKQDGSHNAAADPGSNEGPDAAAPTTLASRPGSGLVDTFA